MGTPLKGTLAAHGHHLGRGRVAREGSDLVRDLLHRLPEAFHVHDDVPGRDIVAHAVIHQPLDGVDGDVQALRHGDEGPAQVVEREGDAGLCGDLRDMAAGLDEVALGAGPREDPGGLARLAALFQQCLDVVGEGQHQGIVVLGVGDRDGPAGKVHVLPTQLHGFAASKPGEEQQQQVVRDGLRVRVGVLPAQPLHGFVPGREIAALEVGAAALDGVPGAGVVEAPDGVVREERAALAVLVGVAREVVDGPQEPHGVVGAGGAVLAQLGVAAGDVILADRGEFAVLPVAKGGIHQLVVVLEGAGLEILARGQIRLEGLLQRHASRLGLLALGDRIGAGGDAPEHLLRLLAGLLHGERPVAAQRLAAHAPVDALLDDETLGPAVGDPQGKAGQGVIAQEPLPLLGGAGLVHHGFRQSHVSPPQPFRL